jgi:hypothetical protein
MAPRPALGLSVVMRGPGGDESTWRSNAPRPGDRPTGLNFRTERGSGFVDGGCVLPRDVRSDWVDLGLLNETQFVGADGFIAYEGALANTPRSMDSSGHSISPSFVGPIALAQDRTFSEIYVDRDLSRWGPASVARRLSLAATFGPVDASVQPDTTTGAPSLAQEIGGPWTVAPGLPIVEAWYDAGAGLQIGSVYYAWKKNANVNNADANWNWWVYAAPDDLATATDGSGNLRGAGPGTGTLATTGTKRFVFVELFYNAGAGGAAGVVYAIYWTCLAVYGNHGLTKQGAGSATTAPALYLSDILINIFNRFAPQIDTSGVQQNTTLIEQCVYRDQFPHDAALDLNKYTLYELGVWENKRLQFEPADLTDYDWEVRLSDPGVTTTLQGDDAKDLRNGLAVQFTEAGSGKLRTLSPDNYPQLRDDSVENPANAWGRDKWGAPYVLSAPCTENMALAAGQQKLAEDNAPKEAGDITVTGHVRDRAGHWQPAYKMRAGETVAITDSANPRPRRISQTSYGHDGYQQTVSVDNSLNEVEAFLDFYGAGLQAANLV